MIQVTGFNRSLAPQVSAALEAVQDAATAALNLCAAYPFVRVVNGPGEVVFSQSSGVSKKRLVHAIATRARVTFEGER